MSKMTKHIMWENYRYYQQFPVKRFLEIFFPRYILWSYIISLSGHKTFKDLLLFFIWKREGDLENFGYVDKICLIPVLRL